MISFTEIMNTKGDLGQKKMSRFDMLYLKCLWDIKMGFSNKQSDIHGKKNLGGRVRK